jgi:uncharacterized lipoprotein PM1897
MFKKLLITLTTTMIIAQTSFADTRSSFDITAGQKRLNTAACADKDDWYLDGYTVTQKHPQYKEKLLKQRIDFCTQKDGSVSEELIQEWHVGEKAYLEGETK